jgi:hypothetical protein
MLRFSLRRTKPAASLPAQQEEARQEAEPAVQQNETVRVNYTSRAWLANLRKRTLSVESLSNMFSGVGRTEHGRRESLNSAGGSITGGSNSKLMKTHKMQTKAGDTVEVYFGYDALSINGRAIPYSDVVFWSHSASHFTMTYLSKSSGRRKEVMLYPTEKGPRPSELTDMLGTRIAKLVADQTGCSEEKAMRMATAKANEAELREAVEAIEQHQGMEEGDRGLPGRQTSEGVMHPTHSGVLDLKKSTSGSGMVEVNTSTALEQASSPEDDGVSRPIQEGDEPMPTPV